MHHVLSPLTGQKKSDAINQIQMKLLHQELSNVKNTINPVGNKEFNVWVKLKIGKYSYKYFFPAFYCVVR